MLANSSVDTLCMNCMSDQNHDGICQNCGFDENIYQPSPHQLPLRTILNGKYLIGRVLGEGGFGITYLGWDLNLDLKIAIKEYYPSGFVTRENTYTNTVTPFTGEKSQFFQSGCDKFVGEAKRLAKFYALPGIVSVKDFFLENGTAYIVMEYVDGVTFKQYLDRMGGKIPTDQMLEMIKPLMKSLIEIHKAGIIHRDISPDNIMITKEGDIKLLDFGAARDFADSGNKSLSVMLKPGYAPEEQYRSRGIQGPWTDEYALCATIYKAITGVTPDESSERIHRDELKKPSELGIAIPQWQEAILIKGMAVLQENRYQTVGELADALYAASAQEEVIPKPQIMVPDTSVPVQSKEDISTNNKEITINKMDALVSSKKSGKMFVVQYLLLSISTLFGLVLSYFLYNWPVGCEKLVVVIFIQSIIILLVNLFLCSRINKNNNLNLEKGYQHFPLIVLILLVAAVILEAYFSLDFYIFRNSGSFHRFYVDGIYKYPLLSFGTALNLLCIAPVLISFLVSNRMMLKRNQLKTKFSFMNICGFAFVALSILIILGSLDTYNTYGNTKDYLAKQNLFKYMASDDNWAYFGKYDGIYRIRKDGKNKTPLTDDECYELVAQGDWIYYTTLGNLYKINKNGTGKIELNNEICDNICINEDWLYYTNEYGNLCRIHTDGSEEMQIGEEGTVFDYYAVSDDWIYYSNSSDNGCIYKIRTDGSKNTKLNDADSSYIEVAGDWIYYMDDNFDLYKINTNGKQKTQINSVSCNYFNIVKDWIYYENRSDNFKVYKIRTDGTDNQAVK